MNVASRIEPLAEDGGVCISRQVYDNVLNKFDLPLLSLGVKSLKNVSTPLELYKIVMPWDPQKTSPVVSNVRRIAIMPFANMSPDPGDEYFADGLTEELISTMSRIEQFEVISRTSVMQFKKNPKPIREVSRELDVGTVLEGSVRKSGNQLRVTVQMIDAPRDRHTWSETYNRELKDVFSIQSEISKAVAEELRIRIVPSEKTKLEQKPTSNTEAYALYLKARYLLNERTREGMEKAAHYFTEATKRDPSFARAYAGLADSYMFREIWGYLRPEDAHEQRRACVAKALELDDSLPEVHVALSSILNGLEWDLDGAERELKKAIELNPNYALAHHNYANGILRPTGRLNEAIVELKEALRLDPLSAITAVNIGDVLMSADRIVEAEEQYRSVLETFPDFPYAHSRLGLALSRQSRHDEAIAEIKKALDLSDRFGGLTPDLILAYRMAGRSEDAERELEKMEQQSAAAPVSNVDFALAYGAAGRKESAMKFLEKAMAEKSVQLRTNVVEPHFNEVRSDPRFQKLLVTIGIKRAN